MSEQLLSEKGRLRREQILQLAQREARRRRRRRFSARGIGMLCLVGFAALLWRHHPTENQTLVFQQTIVQAPVPVASPDHTATPAPASAIEYVQTDPTITDRLTIAPQPPRWTSIDDQQLIDELAAAGQPTGIAWINGKMILLPRSRGSTQ